MIRIAPVAFAFVVVLASAALADEAAATRRATQVRDAPAESGGSIASLPPQAGVTRTGERRGPWVQVRTASGVTGWVHLFDLGPAAATGTATATQGASAIGDALRGVTSLLVGGRPAQAGTTAGIRGLEAQDLARSQPNPYEVTQMEKLRQGDGEARNFAVAAGLHAVAVAPLPAPVPLVPAPGGAPGQPQLP
ncbi:SH3 domain-containing protein [Ramlibacter sp.]|uniref:SH3 domain-containing protein n=1 Tax=Ramlibacter sp. TaxID=1917967 RepID=UPI0026225658|nr:SH3 domain-containing protein [Ramlibacter sp.]MDB5955828.1 hypothetical protein [Ramlibacter sp.]